MIKQTDHSKEWFQATVTFGNFSSEVEANSFMNEFRRNNAHFITSEVKGSWRP
ncbi:hypothetical protein HWB90_gp094 [Mycobacterium phage Fowlmouth]|uniref:Uncharacterized protein n=1 Tax=Mycobacterium phage Fowlmouth TaxID=2419978 RepID=A0A3G2KGF7_9CAUD|nr:hypothetical protein HWB90_gp094 [Mycobacterium phage Fowlmouth]AYN58045.1 hypothetical protein SEA_FOWLMOUTH_96 [Mycobacterium phage Fowlmouth]